MEVAADLFLLIVTFIRLKQINEGKKRKKINEGLQSLIRNTVDGVYADGKIGVQHTSYLEYSMFQRREKSTIFPEDPVMIFFIKNYTLERKNKV